MYYKKPKIWAPVYGDIYQCDHPAFKTCTLFLIDGNGLGVIQQRCMKLEKRIYTYWGEIDPWLANDIYMNENFIHYFHTKAKPIDENGLYPTVSVRQIMWALKMPPLKKKEWETRF